MIMPKYDYHKKVGGEEELRKIINKDEILGGFFEEMISDAKVALKKCEFYYIKPSEQN